jgi:glucosamine--fructose-6-phosphate aminotransferase (isomerizing)
MCGIIGYAGKENACDQLIAGLKKLEYRGYDSAGIALAENGKIKIFKTAGKVAELEASIPQKTASNLGIGHTRWATHGAPDTINAHPHRAGKVTLVHNGIIENEKALRTRLNAQGKTPLSDTDTELIALLTDTLYQGNPIQTLSALQRQLEGSFALGVLFEDHPQTLYALRKDSPLLIGLGDEEYFIASDLTAFLERTRRYLLLEQGEIAEISFDAVRVFAPDGTPVSKQEQVADWGNQQAERGGFAHYMLKEIFEQPQAIKNTLEQVAALPFSPPAGKICIVGCGSAYHAALPGKRAFMNHAKIPAEAHIASEFRYADPLLNQEDLLIAISQSGETADTLAALRLAKKKGVPTLGIVNVRGSSIAREADTVFYTAAGPEISVATTKAYLCQWLTLEILARKAANLPLLPLRQLR